MWGSLFRSGGGLWLSLESPQGMQSSLHFVRWNMRLYLSHCSETRPSFESGHLGVHSTWDRKHRVPITLLFLREGSSWGAWGKLAYLFIRRQGIILFPRWYEVQGTFLKLLYWNWWSSILEKVVSQNLSRFLKGVKPLVLYDVDRGVVMKPMQGKLASSQFDFGYTEQFCIPWVTSVFFSYCDSAVGDSLEFNQANRGSFRVWLGKRNCSVHSARESGLISQRGESLMRFLELWQEHGVYSRVTAGMSFRNWSSFSEVRTPVYVWGTTQERKLGVAGQYGRFWKLSGSSGLFFYLTVILVFLTILKNCQASSKFEAVNSTWLSSCQRHVRPHCEMMWRLRAFCRVYKGDSDIVSSCDMNDEHAWSLCRKFGLLSNQLNSISISLEA